MAVERFWILGEVKIPEEKRDEFNANVIKLLDKSGIRFAHKKELAEHTLTVLNKPFPNENGLIRMNYSIYDEKGYDECTYDTNTFELVAPNLRNSFFGGTMVSIRLLQEIYTDGNCYLMEHDKPLVNPEMFLDFICICLGKKVYLDNRGRMWDFLKTLKMDERVVINKPMDFMESISFRYSKNYPAQMMAVISAVKTSMDKPEKVIESTEEFKSSDKRVDKRDYMYRIMKRMWNEDKTDLTVFLKDILDAKYEKRKEIADQNDGKGVIAWYSLNNLPAEIVSILAIIKEEEFWDCWHNLGIEGYDDIEKEERSFDEEDESDDVRVFPTDMRHGLHDKLIEYWNGENLVLSDYLLEEMPMWKEQLQKVDDITEEGVEEYLAETITEIVDILGCRYVDKAFIDLILCHKDDNNFRKAIVLLRCLTEKDTKFFPELTRKQSLKWVVARYISDQDKDIIMAYQSLLLNEKQRQRVLGF